MNTRPIVEVAGVRYPVTLSSLLWTERINHIPDQLDFATPMNPARNVREGQAVKLYFGSIAAANLRFAGTILDYDVQNSTGLEGFHAYRVTCKDNSRLLDRRHVTGRWTNLRVDQIFVDVISRFTSGFTTTGVQTGSPLLDEYVAVDKPVSQVLTELAQIASGATGTEWNWRLDPDSDLALFDRRADLPEADSIVESLNSDGLAALPYDSGIWIPTMSVLGARVRNRVIYEIGGSVTTAAVSAGDTTIAVDDVSRFVQLLQADPDGSGVGTARLGADLISFTGPTTGSGPGSITGIPASGLGSVTYGHDQGQEVLPRVIRNNATSQIARKTLEAIFDPDGDGVHESFHQERNATVKTAVFRADAELQGFHEPERVGTYRTHDPNAQPGADLLVNVFKTFRQALSPFGTGIIGATGESSTGSSSTAAGELAQIVSPLRTKVLESANLFAEIDQEQQMVRQVTYGTRVSGLMEFLERVEVAA